MTSDLTEKQGTTLCSLPIRKISDANKLIGELHLKHVPGGYGASSMRHETPLVLIPAKNALRFYTFVPEGFYAMLYRRGQYKTNLEPGIHLTKPFSRVYYLISRQLTVFDTPVKKAPTQDNVNVDIDTVLVFKISADNQGPRNFILKLGPEKLDRLLRDAQEEAVRGLARSTRLNDIYSLSGYKTNPMVRGLNDKFLTQFGVEIIDVTITNVVIPDEIAERLENISWFATREKDRVVTFDYQTLKQKHRQEITERKTLLENRRISANKNAELARVRLQKEIALTKQITENKLATMSAQLHDKISRMNADNEKQIAQNRANKISRVEKVNNDAANEETRLRSEQEAYCRKTISNAQLKCAEYRAKALEKEAEAEEEMSKMLRAKRQYEADQTRLGVLESLCQNGNLIISGNNGILSKSTDLAAMSMPALAYEQMILDSVTNIAKSIPSGTGEGATIQQSMMLDSLHGMYSSRKR